MATKPLMLHARIDPDFPAKVEAVPRLVRAAYDAGAISWDRRCALLDLCAENPSALFDTQQSQPEFGDGTIRVDVFIDLKPGIAAELCPAEPRSHPSPSTQA